MMKRKRKPQTNTVMIDRALYQALEAQEQVAARQHAEIERLREVVRLARIALIDDDMPFGEWGSSLARLREELNALPTV